MFCGKCGREIKNSARFCQFCGARINPDYKTEDFETEDIDSAESEYEELSAGEADRAQEDSDRTGWPDMDEKPRKSGKKLLAAAVIAAACAAVVFLAVHFIHPGSDDNKNSKTASQTEEASEERSEEKNKSVRDRFENIPEEEIEPFTEEETGILEEAAEGIDRLAEDFLNEEGYIEPEDCESFLDGVEEYIGGLEKSGEVADWERNETSVSVLFESGIRYYITAPVKGLLSSGEDETRVLALETFSGSDYGMFDPDRNLSDKDLKKIARKIDEDSDQYTFDEGSDYREVENVSIQYLKNLDGFKLLLWHGHGGYSTKDGTTLMTNQDYKAENHSLDTDMKLGRIVIAHSFEWGPFKSPDKYAITSKFVDKYFPDIDNAIVYLGACESCGSSDLADSFIRRGARCVIGYSKTVYAEYEMNCRAQLFERLRTGENIPDAIANTTKAMVLEPGNYIAGGLLKAFFAKGTTAEEQYLESGERKDIEQNQNNLPRALPDPENLSVGQEITFGQYYRDYEYPNDKMPVEWEVLDVQDGRALIISKYALMNYPYLDYFGECTWETSSLREWMNNDFYNAAFTDEEKQIIGLTELENEDNSQYHTDGGNDTKDRVFALSAEEAEKYFSSDRQRQAAGTTWAYNNGLALISPSTGDYSSVVFNGVYGYLEDFYCQYWLRTPGADNGAAAYVDEKGAIQLGGYYAYYYPDADPKVASNLPEVGVRPALWLVSDTSETDETDETAAEERDPEASALMEAYRAVMKNYDDDTMDSPRYCFGFIDGDDVPELMIARGFFNDYHAAGVDVYTYKDGAAVQTGVFGSDGNISYIPYENVIFSYWIGQGHTINTYSRMDGTVIHTLHNTDTAAGLEPVWKVDDSDVSEEEFNSMSEQIRLDYPEENRISIGPDHGMYDFSDDSGFEWLQQYFEEKTTN